MAAKSLGAVTVASHGTAIPISNTRISCQSITFQALPTNTGKVYIGTSALVVATFVGSLGIVPAATANVIPSVTFTIVEAPEGLNIGDFYIDTGVDNEGVLISYTEQ